MMNRYFLCGSPILNGGHACFLFKQIRKIVDIVDTYFVGNLGSRQRAAFQKLFCPVDPKGDEIIVGGEPGIFFEFFGQLIFIHAGIFC